ncbi:MAG: SPOR domain-containing protein [Proteobacteria bacterium]|nr:SPOR domain-containing protein [Pseudomonadota bacterium]
MTHRTLPWLMALLVLSLPPGAEPLAQLLPGEAATADSGDAQANFELGVLAYRDGDVGAAQGYWRRAAAGGHLDAHYNLGLTLLWAKADDAAIDAEFAAAARGRHVLACYALGTRLAARDEAAARAWLECAASQGYAPAQYNLATLYARAPREAGALDTARRWYAAAASHFAPAADALAALPQAPAAATPPATSSTLKLRGNDWVMAQPANAYTVQIASGGSAAVLEAMLAREVASGDAACVHEHPRARQAYSAIVGSFVDRASAESARAALPASLRANNPWVRRMGSLQQALRDADKHQQADAAAHAESN